MQDKLFKQLPTAALLRVEAPEPAATPLARYVLARFPADLAACVAGDMQLADLADRHHKLLSKERSRIAAAADREAAHETQLDMVLLLGAYLLDRQNALRIAPSVLLELLESNAARHGFAARMTYELIVDVNTAAFVRTGGHIRVFTQGNTARTERDFYIDHFFAEKHMVSAYETLRDILDNPLQAAKAERLKLVIAGLQQFTSYIHTMMRLPPAEYALFRRFLAAYPDGIKNASGAFMPTPQLFEMLLHPPGFAQVAFITDNARYFSRQANEAFARDRRQSEAGRTLMHMLDRELRLTPDEALLMHEVVEQFTQFKLAHIRMASSKIPEAFPKPPILEREALRTFQPLENVHRSGEGPQQGTGGFVPQDFLGDGVRRLLELQQQLSKKHAPST